MKTHFLRAFCVLCTLFVSSSVLHSSDWMGEAMDMNLPYYFYDAERGAAGLPAYLSYVEESGSYYVSYSNIENASYFMAIDANDSKTIYLENITLRDKEGISACRMYVSGINQKASYATVGSKFSKNPSARSNTFGYKFSFHNSNLNVALQGVISEFDIDYISSPSVSRAADATKKWYFISPEQFNGRQELDALIDEVLAVYGSTENMPADVKKMYDDAVTAQKYVPQKVGELGPKITSANSNLSTAYSKYKSVCDQINAGVGYTEGTDFSSYILNNSFQLGNVDYWDRSNTGRGAVTNASGNYYYKSSSNLSQTISQVVKGLPTGIYKLEATLSNQSSFKAYVDGNSTAVDNIENISVSAGQTLKIEVTASSNKFTADDFKLTLIGGAATVTKTQTLTISQYGYATCVSEYNLDFTGREDGLVAYGVVPEIENNVVHFVELEKVPANTAFIIAGKAGSYTMDAVLEADPIAEDDNKLIYRTTSVDYSGEFAGFSIYYFGVSSDDKAVFKLLSGGSLAANKGFFVIPNVSSEGAPMYRISILDKVENETSIEAVQEVTQDGEVIYTLSGQKVDQVAESGLYIVNNKKVWLSK